MDKKDKTVYVELHNSTEGIKPQKLEIGHAERLLRMLNNGGWMLPDNSKYIFKDGSITAKSDKGDKETPGK